MTTLFVEEIDVFDLSDDNEIAHFTCHCTKDQVAACGMYVGGMKWSDESDDLDCRDCYDMWPDNAPTCPWGCNCEEECGPP